MLHGTRRGRFTYALSVCVLVTGFGFEAQAQSDEMHTLEEIVVHARKRTESLQTVPVVANVITAEQIERYKIKNLEAVAANTPGLVIGEAAIPGGGFLAIRGVSTASIANLADQSISTVIDNLNMSKQTFTRSGNFDVEQIEVLKGPQALFFGKNSPGGLINIRSKDPTEETEIFVGAGYESEGEEYYVEGAISGALSDSVKARIFARFSDIDGYFTNTAVADPTVPFGFADGPPYDTWPNGDETFVRGTLILEPSDTVSMRTKLSYNKTDNNGHVGGFQQLSCNGPNGLPQQSSSVLGQFTFQSTQPCKADDQAPHHQAPPDVAALLGIPQETRGGTETTLFSHEMDFDLTDRLTLTSVTGFYDIESFFDGSVWMTDGGTFGAVRTVVSQDYISQEFRLSSNFDGPFNYMLGAFYGEGEGSAEVIVAFEPFASFGLTDPTLVTPLNYPVTQEEETYSVFAQLEYDISDSLTVSAGARWSDETKKQSAVADGVPVDPSLFSPNEVGNDDVSPEVSLSYQATEDTMYFVSYKEGFKSGGFNQVIFLPSAPRDDSYEAETIEGFEAGLKSEFQDGRVRLNVAVFAYTVENLQLGLFDSTQARLTIQNAGDTDTRGVEVESTFLPESIDGLMLSAALTYTDAEHKGFTFKCFDGQSIAQGCTGLPDLNGDGRADDWQTNATQDFDGVQPLASPELQANLNALYETQVGSGYILALNASANYSDEYFYEAEHNPKAVQDSYWKINAGVSLTSPDDRWTASLQGMNLTEEYTVVVGGVQTGTSFAVNGVPPDLFGMVSRGREVWFEFKYRL